MNFYQAQDQARKRSRLLVTLFVVAVGFLVLITNLLVALFVLYSNPEYSLGGHAVPGLSAHNIFEGLAELARALGWQKSLWITLLVCGFVFFAMALRWSSLRQGGRVVAESLGGTLVQPNSRDIREKRLLNVVEEMALAAGIPAPQVYLLKNEPGINAFAAGLGPEDAVIGVTQGSLNHFNREQLQGVIAHEFSHILNGDMRLNMKLIAVLHGILMIAESGYFFMRISMSSRHSSRGRRDNGGFVFLFLLGACLWLIGALGQLFGAIIKSAVSRQREFLADASAVQFTRNPEGISQALSIIGGASVHSGVQHHVAHEISHLFFSDANKFIKNSVLFHPSKWSVFATHPPLVERIKRIQPRWNGDFIKASASDQVQTRLDQPDPVYPSFAEMQSRQQVPGSLDVSLGASIEQRAVVDTRLVEFVSPFAVDSSVTSSITTANAQQAAFESLSELAHQPYDATLLILSFAISAQVKHQNKQFELITSAFPAQAEPRLNKIKWMQAQIHNLNGQQRLALIEKAMPSLKTMSLQQYQQERSLLLKLIQADGKVAVFEWLLFQLVRQYLDRHFGLTRSLKPKYKTLASLASIYQTVLSRVVHYGFEEDDALNAQDKRLAFNRACEVAGVKGLKLLPLEACDGKLFSQAVSSLSQAYPLLKPRLLKGCLEAVHFDRQVTDQERYVLSAIASVMDCPLIGLDEPRNSGAEQG